MAQRTYKFQASDATRESILLRAAICGPTGSGKTKTGLILGTRMVERMGLGPVYVIDSENKSALRYALSPKTRQGFRFKHVPMPEDDYSTDAYMGALDYCESQGAGVILIDSLSHAWMGINGVLEQVDQVTQNSRTKNSFSEGWKAMTPKQNRLIQRILGSSAHVIFTLRAKVDWVVQENERGKKEPVKLGMAPIQREGVDYEPDLFFDMTAPDNALVVSKTRCDRLEQGTVFKKPGAPLADIIVEWIQDSEPAPEARTLGEAVNMAVAEGILAAEERSPDRYKEAKRRLIAWCEANGVAQARRDTALAQFKERVALVAGPRTTDATSDAAPPSTPSNATAPADAAAPTSNAPATPTPEPAQNASPAYDLRAILDRLSAAGSVEEVRAAYAPAWKVLGHADTPDGIAFRNAIEGAMQRFHAGWTIAGAEAAKARAEGAAAQPAPAQNGGAPAAARAPEGTKGTRRATGSAKASSGAGARS